MSVRCVRYASLIMKQTQASHESKEWYSREEQSTKRQRFSEWCAAGEMAEVNSDRYHGCSKRNVKGCAMNCSPDD